MECSKCNNRIVGSSYMRLGNKIVCKQCQSSKVSIVTPDLNDIKDCKHRLFQKRKENSRQYDRKQEWLRKKGFILSKRIHKDLLKNSLK